MNDRAERHDFGSRFLLFILLYFFLIFLGGKRKGGKNNQIRGKKTCLSARSMWTWYMCVLCIVYYRFLPQVYKSYYFIWCHSKRNYLYSSIMLNHKTFWVSQKIPLDWTIIDIYCLNSKISCIMVSPSFKKKLAFLVKKQKSYRLWFFFVIFMIFMFFCSIPWLI